MRSALLFSLALLLAGCATADRPPALATDFGQNPAAEGWAHGELASESETRFAMWSEMDSGQPGVLTAMGTYWQTPWFAVRPGAHYRLSARARADAPVRLAARFAAEPGEAQPLGHVGELPAAKTWGHSDLYFTAPPGTDRARVRLQPRGKQTTLQLDELSVTPVSARELIAAADARYGKMTKVPYQPTVGRLKPLGRTIAKLEAGQPVRIVMLGDGAMNELANSHWELLVERLYPEARIEVVRALGKRRGCAYFLQGDRLDQQVTRHNPDLVMIGGTSNDSVGAIEQVVGQLRERSDCDIMLQTTPRGNKAFKQVAGGAERMKPVEYRKALKELTKKHDLAFLNLRRAWIDHLKASNAPTDAFTLDQKHLSARGREVLARVMEKFFAPVAQASEPKAAPATQPAATQPMAEK